MKTLDELILSWSPILLAEKEDRANVIKAVKVWIEQQELEAPSIALTEWKHGFCDGYKKALTDLENNLST